MCDDCRLRNSIPGYSCLVTRIVGSWTFGCRSLLTAVRCLSHFVLARMLTDPTQRSFFIFGRDWLLFDVRPWNGAWYAFGVGRLVEEVAWLFHHPRHVLNPVLVVATRDAKIPDDHKKKQTEGAQVTSVLPRSKEGERSNSGRFYARIHFGRCQEEIVNQGSYVHMAFTIRRFARFSRSRPNPLLLSDLKLKHQVL